MAREVCVVCERCKCSFSYVKTTGVPRRFCAACRPKHYAEVARASTASYYSDNRESVLRKVRAAWAEAHPRIRDLICADCGATFEWTVRRGMVTRFCDGCGTERRRAVQRAWRRRNKEKVCDQSRLRRARKATGANEHIDRLAVLMRDEGCCHLCGLAVDLTNWHLDHVVPIARGGSHTYKNVRVAHPECNLRKGVRLVGEAA